MDGVDISSSSETGDDEMHAANNNDLSGKESYESGDNLAMESDVDAELDYDEENGDDEGLEERSQEQTDENRLMDSDDGNGESEGYVKRNGGGAESDCDKGLNDKNAINARKDKEEVECELSEEGEIDDLEEGELKSDEESITGSVHSDDRSARRPMHRSHEKESERAPQQSWRDDPASVGICKFYLRGTCTWGPDCKYLHIKEPRTDGSVPVQSSSSESTWPQRSDADKTRRSRSRELTKPSISARVVYPSSSTSNENETSRGNETAWEKGLRQARELMIKASRKREEEPDFDRKRLILAPSEDMDHPRTTDEESDDSRGHRRMHRRTSRSPLSRSVVRGANGFMVRARFDAPPCRPRRYDDPMGPDDTIGDRYMEPERRGGCERRELAKPRKIPSLIDTMLEGRRFEPPRRYDYGRDEPPRIPPKDLGPQVLYPNGRPTARRRAPPPRRETSPNDRRYVQRRDSPPRNSRSPLPRTPRDSRSPTPRRSFSPPPKRRASPVSLDSRREVNRRQNNALPGLISAGDQFYDPWERGHKKERSKDKELMSLTLGAELQKARRSNDDRRQSHRKDTTSSVSSASRRSVSATSSATSRSRSRSRAPSKGRSQPASRLSLASAVASKNLIDDDGSLRATDLSSFRIPKKKRSSPASSLHRLSTANRGYKQPLDGPNNQDKRCTSSAPPKRSPSSLSHRSGTTERNRKVDKGVSGRADEAHKRSVSPAGKEDISSDESSSTTSGSSSSSSDDTEPAAYRLKKKVDDGLPTEGIPLSPEAAAEDVSSDEDENASDTPVHVPAPQRSKRTSSTGSSRSASRKAASAAANCYESGIGDDDYVDNEAEKEERRAELIRQLKCVEAAIARKRSRPVA